MPDDPTDHIRRLLESLGLNADADPELAETPQRFADLLEAMFKGVDEPPPDISVMPNDAPVGDGDGAEPVVLTALPFYSMCVHHLVPFFGTIDVAYCPDGEITGFGSVGRVVDHFARRPQIQERLVEQIAGHLDEALAPHGLLVRCRARQLCMELRGAEKTGTLVTTAARGTLGEGAQRRDLMETFRAEQEGP